jgi:hypothetical protein
MTEVSSNSWVPPSCLKLSPEFLLFQVKTKKNFSRHQSINHRKYRLDPKIFHELIVQKNGSGLRLFIKIVSALKIQKISMDAMLLVSFR